MWLLGWPAVAQDTERCARAFESVSRDGLHADSAYLCEKAVLFHVLATLLIKCNVLKSRTDSTGIMRVLEVLRGYLDL